MLKVRRGRKEMFSSSGANQSLLQDELLTYYSVLGSFQLFQTRREMWGWLIQYKLHLLP